MVGQAQPLANAGLRTWGDGNGENDLQRMLAERGAFLDAALRPGDRGGAAVSALIRDIGTDDPCKLYLIAERDDIDFNVGWIPAVGGDLLRPGKLSRDLPPHYIGAKQ